MENDKLTYVLYGLVILVIIGVLIGSIVVEIKCWNIPIMNRSGWCALLHR